MTRATAAEQHLSTTAPEKGRPKHRKSLRHMPPSRPSRQEAASKQGVSTVSVGLSAVIVSASFEEPRVLVVPESKLDGLPSGPLELHHRTLQAGLRAWVERQTQQQLGYVEQLYTFGDLDRVRPEAGASLAIAYLALVGGARSEVMGAGAWENWYRYLPWEDWRAGRPAVLDRTLEKLNSWASDAASEALRRDRLDRIELTFGSADLGWNEERVLERYELLYAAQLVPEAWRDRGDTGPSEETTVPGRSMLLDHRRMLATGVGRLRSKIKYRPVVFELMPPAFTLLQLQRTVEALAGLRLHKQNFRRLVETQGLVEETGESTSTAGRPARLVRFRREVLLERPAPGLRLPRTI